MKPVTRGGLTTVYVYLTRSEVDVLHKAMRARGAEPHERVDDEVRAVVTSHINRLRGAAVTEYVRKVREESAE